MRTTLEPRTFGMFFSLLLLCSCATTPEPSAIIPASELPADVIMNEDAGRGGWLFVTIRLESGEELPFIVDTGSSWTLIDKSLEPKLGKRLGTMRVPIFGSRAELDRYAAPGLYMGSTRLLTGNNIYTSHHLTQLSFRSHQSIMGVIGMDCLKHSCIQLDFETRKMRFLDSNRLNPAELGRAFPLTFRFLPFIHHAGPVAGASSNWWLIDTGCNIDGLVSAPLFRRELGDERDDSISTNRAGGGPGNLHDNLWFPKCAWNGATYTNLLIGTAADLIGLRFLARHLVTFDYPGRKMYLKQTSVGPLAGDTLVERVNEAIRAPGEFLESLREKGQLPGRSKNDKGQWFCIYHFQGETNSFTFAFREDGDSATCHYRVTRASKDGPWKLRKAWRTYQHDPTLNSLLN